MDVMELKSALGARTRLLGLDLGEKTIGIAVSDPGQTIATPVETIKRTKFSHDAARHAQRLESFADEFAAILSRQIDLRN